MSKRITTQLTGPTANTEASFERLIVVEQKQKEMTEHLANLTQILKENTTMTLQIKQTLDELTGVKKFLVWLTGSIVGIIGIVELWLGFHHK